MQLDEAIAVLVELLSNGAAARYGHDLYTRAGAEAAAGRAAKGDDQKRQSLTIELAPVFMDAGWELCRRGIVRPGVNVDGGQDVGGYSLTLAGREALASIDHSSILILQPGSLAATFTGYRERFGAGFYQRAQEAIKCRNAEAWLACCAMAGAAAESILLALAVAKSGSEEDVLEAYRRSGGRQRVLNIVVGQASAATQNTLSNFTGIVSFWRDEAAHGQESPLSTANADETLRQLLHMCQWVDGEWDRLIS